MKKSSIFVICCLLTCLLAACGDDITNYNYYYEVDEDVTDETSEPETGSGGLSGRGEDGEAGAGGSEGEQVCPPEDYVSQKKLNIVIDKNTPPSEIVVAGQNSWHIYSQYKVTNLTDEDQEIRDAEIAQFDPNGDAADFTEVALALEGKIVLTGSKVVEIVEQGKLLEEHFFLDNATSNEVIIPAKSSVLVQVWAKLAPVLPSSAVGGVWHGVPRSGHSNSLGIELIGVKSDPVCVGQGSDDLNHPPSMVTRKSKPVVTPLPISSNGLLEGVYQELFKFQIGAHEAGAIDLTQFALKWTKTPGLLIMPDSLGLHKDNVPMKSFDEVWIFDQDGYLNEIHDPDVTTGTVVFIFFESIVESGLTFTFRGRPSGAKQGSKITFTFDRVPEDLKPVTARLDHPASGPGSTLCKDVNLCYPDLGPDWAGTFLWSDRSEVPHGSTTMDWTNDLYVENLNQTQTLTF